MLWTYARCAQPDTISRERYMRHLSSCPSLDVQRRLNHGSSTSTIMLNLHRVHQCFLFCSLSAPTDRVWAWALIPVCQITYCKMQTVTKLTHSLLQSSRHVDGRSDCGPLGLLRLPNILHSRLLPSPPFSAALAFFWMFAMSISFSNSRDVLSARCAFALSSRAPAGRWRSS